MRTEPPVQTWDAPNSVSGHYTGIRFLFESVSSLLSGLFSKSAQTMAMIQSRKSNKDTAAFNGENERHGSTNGSNR